jgi:plasmid stabilization system protein ParE
MQVKITDQAKCDIKSIREYIAKDNKVASASFTVQLKRTFVNLSIYPKIGRYRYEFKEGDIYTYVFKSYIIVYKLSNSELKILRVLSDYCKLTTILRKSDRRN